MEDKKKNIFKPSSADIIGAIFVIIALISGVFNIITVVIFLIAYFIKKKYFDK